MDIGFKCEFIRIGSFGDAPLGHMGHVESSAAGLLDFFGGISEEFSVWPQALAALEKYDEGFFEEHSLIVLLLEEPSGSVSHVCEGVSLLGGALQVEIHRSMDGIGTADMANWAALIEIGTKYAGYPVKLTINKL